MKYSVCLVDFLIVLQVPPAVVVPVCSAGWTRQPQRGGGKRIQTPQPFVLEADSRLRQRRQRLPGRVLLHSQGR